MPSIVPVVSPPRPGSAVRSCSRGWWFFSARDEYVEKKWNWTRQNPRGVLAKSSEIFGKKSRKSRPILSAVEPSLLVISIQIGPRCGQEKISKSAEIFSEKPQKCCVQDLRMVASQSWTVFSPGQLKSRDRIWLAWVPSWNQAWGATLRARNSARKIRKFCYHLVHGRSGMV